MEIGPCENAVLVSYGRTAKSGRFYCRIGIDVFHEKCEKAFRSEPEVI